MSYEIEKKARLDSILNIEEKLKAIAKFSGTDEKYDIYYFNSKTDNIDFKNDPIFRIRKNNKGFFITFKTREFSGKTEINTETEFEIINPEGLHNLFEFMGYKILVEKHKVSKIYSYKNASIELNNIKYLGDFIEVEIVCNSELEKNDAIKQIDEIFSILEIPDENVEDRYYIDLLLEKR